MFIIYKPRILGTIARRSLQERLDAGETILCAEGYILGLARRGYIGTGVWTGQFMLDYPEPLTSLHYEFVHCGSDVVQALQVILIKLYSLCTVQVLYLIYIRHMACASSLYKGGPDRPLKYIVRKC